MPRAARPKMQRSSGLGNGKCVAEARGAETKRESTAPDLKDETRAEGFFVKTRPREGFATKKPSAQWFCLGAALSIVVAALPPSDAEVREPRVWI